MVNSSDVFEVYALATDARGIAKDEAGRVWFIEGALPGEQVSARVLREHKNYVDACVQDVIKASSLRISKPCSYGDACGGCQLLHVNVAEQQRFKKQWLLETLARVGHWSKESLADAAEVTKVVAASSLNYRHRMRFHVTPNSVGFAHKGDSKKIVDLLNPCPIGDSAISSRWSEIRKFFLTSNTSKAVFEAEITVEYITGKLSLSAFCPQQKKHFVRPDKNLERDLVRIEGEWQKLPFALSGDEISIKHPYIPKFTINKLSFVQGHSDAITLYCNYITKYCETFIAKIATVKAADLYCGAGPLSCIPQRVALSQKKEFSVVAVEGNRFAVKICEKNLAGLGISCVNDDVQKFVANYCKDGKQKFNLIIVDPPRAGMGQEAAKELISILAQDSPCLIIWIACSAAAFARDGKVLLEHGFSLRELNIFDTFAHTFHYETIAFFERPQL